MQIYGDPSAATTALSTRGAFDTKSPRLRTLRRRFGNKALWKLLRLINKYYGDSSSQAQRCETNGEDRNLAGDEQFYMNLEGDDSSEDQREEHHLGENP